MLLASVHCLHAHMLRIAAANIVVVSPAPTRRWLKRNLPADQGGGGGVGAGKDLVWNFNKFIVDKQGRPVAFHYQQYDAPKIEADVYKLLQQ